MSGRHYDLEQKSQLQLKGVQLFEIELKSVLNYCVSFIVGNNFGATVSFMIEWKNIAPRDY